MQPSQYDIQREVEALRDLRRRSTNPGALAIDPDLPNQTSPASPTAAYWTGAAAQVQAAASDESSRLSGESASSSSDHGSASAGGDGSNQNAADDPFHLFWVPAGLHPEIAPAEFRAFLKEHARNVPPSDGSAPLERSLSGSAGGLDRRRSMLSRQYKPSEHDGVEEENIVPLRRNRSSHNNVPQLTISDLQKLEELAEEASQSDDPSKFRNILRRSLSLNVAPTAIDPKADMSDMGDEADAPIIVPPPGQILRRAARTKIRKPTLPGDGGGHRFKSTRRGQGRAGTAPASSLEGAESRTSNEYSASDHSDHQDTPSNAAQYTRPRAFSNEQADQARPESLLSEETAAIFDAYAREESDDGHAIAVVTESPTQSMEDLSLPAETAKPIEPEPEPIPQTQPLAIQPAGSTIHQPQPQYMLTPQSTPQDPRLATSRSPSPSESSISTSEFLSRSPPSFLSSPPPPATRKEKDKKGLFGKWGSDKGSKKSKKEKEKEKDQTEAKEKVEKEKESGFFGSLFGNKKNKDSDSSAASQSGLREGGQSSLKSKGFTPVSPGNALAGLPPGVNNYSRYPIHVERAIYRLSHIKLANPRRPLYEQVLISNLMFWYLGVINKAQNPGPNGQTPNGQPQQAGGANTQDGEADPAEQERLERERREREEAERLEKERAEQERQEREQREAEMKKKESGPRRGPLTKPPPAGAGSRHAEMPVKGPQYDLQHRVIEQEYGGYGGYSGQQSPPGNRSPVQQYSRPYQQQTFGGQQQYGSQQPASGPPQLSSSGIPDSGLSELYYFGSSDSSSPTQPLPPGAMPPADTSSWMSQTSPTSRSRRSQSPPSPPRSSDMSNGRPTRSLSATATSSQPNGAKLRKGFSASASVPDRRPALHTPSLPNGIGEEEDVPLAVYQQQRRR